MKRNYLLGLGIAFVAIAPVVAQIPGSNHLFGSSVNAQNVQNQPQLKLNLTAEKQITDKNTKKVTWQPIKDGAVVNPGEVLRYNLVGENKGNSPAKNLVLNQPIPKGTAYILKSATPNGGKLSFSINGGKTFSPNPVVAVKLPDGKVQTRPAPASMYTNVRWDFNRPINAKSQVKVSYKVVVR